MSFARARCQGDGGCGFVGHPPLTATIRSVSSLAPCATTDAVSSDKTGCIWDLKKAPKGKSSGATAVLDLKGHQRAITSVALQDTFPSH